MFSNMGPNDDDGEWTFNNPSYGANGKRDSQAYTDMGSYWYNPVLCSFLFILSFTVQLNCIFSFFMIVYCNIFVTRV